MRIRNFGEWGNYNNKLTTKKSYEEKIRKTANTHILPWAIGRSEKNRPKNNILYATATYM